MLGAVAVGALAIGAVAIGRLVIGRAKIRRLEIDELVVQAGPAEPCRQHRFQQPDQRCPGERGALAGQLLEAADLREMGAEAEPAQGAVARPVLDLGRVA